MKATVTDGQYAELSNGTRLHYASAGTQEGRKLMVFLHGFPEAWFTWEEQLAEFGDDYFAVAPDLRGFNLSAKPVEVEAYHIKHIVEDIRLLIAHLGYSSTIIVCHDWGGAVGWHLAIFHPELVERLIVINSPHPWLFMRALAGDPVQQKASAYMNWLRTPGSERGLVDNEFQIVERFMNAEDGTPPAWYTPEVRARYRTMWSVPGAQGADGTPSHAMTGGVNFYRATPLNPPTKNEPARPLPDASEWTTRVPVRVIWGENDRALTPGLVNGLDQVCPDLRIVRIPEGSHWIAHEQTARVNGLLRAFLLD